MDSVTNTILALSIWLLSIFTIVIFVIKVFKKEIRVLNDKLDFKFFLIIALFLNLFTFFMVYREEMIYIWDFSGYWYLTLSFTDVYFSEPVNVIQVIFKSINNDLYNYFPSFFISPILEIFGRERAFYVLSIINIFLIPSIYCALLLINSLITNLDKFQNSILLLFLALVPALLSPVLTFGYVSVVGIIPMCLIFILILKIHQAPFSIKYSISLAVLFVVAVLLRRWFGIWCLSTVICYVMFLAYYFYTKKNTGIGKDLIKYVKTFVVVGGTGCLILGVFFWDFLTMSLGVDYSDLYSAYGKNSTLYQFWLSYQRIGGIPLLVILIGFFYLKDKKLVTLYIIVVVHLVLTILLFSKIQDFNLHHNYLLLVNWFVLLGLTVPVLVNRIPFFKYIAVLIVLLTFVLPQFKSFKSESLAYAFPNVSLKPNYNPNVDFITDLYYYLKKISEGEKQALYIVASDLHFNNESVNNIKFPDEYNSIGALLSTKHIDKRDGLPIDLITKAKFVVVSDKAKNHMDIEDQWVIAKFNDWIYDGAFSDKYETLKVFEDDNLGEIVVKKRKEAFSLKDIEFILNEFKTKYEAYPNLTTIPLLDKKIVGRELGDHWSEIYLEGSTIEDLQIKLYPGETTYTGFTYNLDEESTSLSFKASQYNTEEIQKQCLENGAGSLDLKIYSENLMLLDSTITWKKDVVFNLENIQSNQLKFEVYSGENDFCDWFILQDFKED